MAKGYIALITVDDATGQFEVEFPGLTGCITCGDTFDEAAANAREALAGWLGVSAEHGDIVPEGVEPDARVAAPAGARVLWVPAPD